MNREPKGATALACSRNVFIKDSQGMAGKVQSVFS